MRHFGVIGLLVVVTTLFVAGHAVSQARVSLSATYDFLPYQTIDEPIEMEDGSIVDDAQVRLSKFRATLMYPVFFSQGKTMLVNEFSYQRIKFDYRKTTSLLDKLHGVSYTLTLLHRLSEDWSVLAMAKPSLASDFKTAISDEDISFQTAVVATRHFNERFSMGLGATYSTQFGSAVPLPLLTLDWNDGEKWSAKAILPASLELWYDAGGRVDLGLLVASDGDNYNFDPGEYQVESPELRYTMLTVGPTTRIALSKRFNVNVEVGIIALHRFEFYAGDKEVIANDLEPSHYARLRLQINL